MLSIFGYNEKKFIGFEDVKFAINNDKFLIINTLPSNKQNILIKNTLDITKEEEVINNILYDYKTPDKSIIIYGKNSCDTSVNTKYDQLYKLGFRELFIYSGGLFEWLLLQDIYGDENFQTTTSERDILKYQGQSRFHLLLTN